MDPLLAWRKEFPIVDETVYLISNSLGAMPRAVYDKVHEYADIWATRGVRAWEEGWWEMPVVVGDLVGRIIGADPGTVTMHQNVTLAEAIVLSCFDFDGRRDKVVSTDMNFPSVLYLYQQMLPAQARLELVRTENDVSIPLEKLLAAIDEETLLVPISHVLFRSAYLQNAAAIIERAHQVGAYVVLDAYQSVGTVPVDVKALDVDFLIGGCLKWLCGGPGGVFLYVRPDLARKLKPRLTGWMAHPHPFDFEVGPMVHSESPFRFLNGTPGVPCLYAVQPGLEIIHQIGAEAIREKSVRQTSRLIALADERGFRVTAPRNPDERGGTVAVDVPHGYAVCQELIRRQFLVDYRPQAGIRISPHFYTRDEELDLVMDEIQNILETRAYEIA